MTHELRTPLTSFRMYTEMLASGMVPDPAQRTEYLERLKGEAERLAHLVENVLFYARIESGRARASVEPLALRPLVERHAETLRARAASLGLRLEVSAETIEAAAAVSADPGGVEQILTNLVDNACKYACSARSPSRTARPRRASPASAWRSAGAWRGRWEGSCAWIPTTRTGRRSFSA